LRCPSFSFSWGLLSCSNASVSACLASNVFCYVHVERLNANLNGSSRKRSTSQVLLKCIVRSDWFQAPRPRTARTDMTYQVVQLLHLILDAMSDPSMKLTKASNNNYLISNRTATFQTSPPGSLGQEQHLSTPREFDVNKRPC